MKNGSSVSPRVMADTNVLVYASDADEGPRHARAVELLADLVRNGNIGLASCRR